MIITLYDDDDNVIYSADAETIPEALKEAQEHGYDISNLYKARCSFTYIPVAWVEIIEQMKVYMESDTRKRYEITKSHVLWQSGEED